MIVVIDPSSVAASILEDEAYRYAEQLVCTMGDGDAVSSSLFWHEIRNLLWQSERRARIHSGDTEKLLRDLREAPPEIIADVSDVEIIAMARNYTLSAYDASYAVIAARKSIPLATLDKKLIAAGEAGAFQLWSPED